MAVPYIVREFTDLVLSPNSHAIWENNEWCVPQFMGVESQIGRNTIQEQVSSRRARVTDEDQLRRLQAGGQQTLKTFHSQLEFAGVLAHRPDMPQIDATAADQAQRREVQDAIGQSIIREVVNEV